MIRQSFTIKKYWTVIVYYDLDYHRFDNIIKELKDVGASNRAVWHLYKEMYYGNAKAVTFSSIERHTSIVLFNEHKTRQDYIDSIVHEAEHVKQAVLDVYGVEDEGEDAAYTIGYIVGQMYEGFYKLMCDCSQS